MNIYLIIYILVVHWVADFIVQTRGQAEGKSHSLVLLTDHVAFYCLAFYTALSIPNVYDPKHQWFLYVAINGVLHWITDYFTSRLNAHLWQAKRTKAFWIGIGADQLIHTTTLLLTAHWLLT